MRHAISKNLPHMVEYDLPAITGGFMRVAEIDTARVERMLRVNVLGPMIASLLSADNRWVTGQRIEVSGGQAL